MVKVILKGKKGKADEELQIDGATVGEVRMNFAKSRRMDVNRVICGCTSLDVNKPFSNLF